MPLTTRDRQPGHKPFFWEGGAVAANGFRVRSFVRGGGPLLRTRGMIGSSSVHGMAPTWQLHIARNPSAVSGSGHTRKQTIRRCHPYRRKSDSQAVLSTIQLTIHATRRTPHGASRLALVMSACSVKTRRAPSWHCRDARVYGCLLYTSPSPRDLSTSRMPSSA